MIPFENEPKRIGGMIDVSDRLPASLEDPTPRMTVRFIRGHAPYNAGEVAGFLPDYAAELVKFGAAEFWPPKSNPEQDSSPAKLATPEPEQPEQPEAKSLAGPPVHAMVTGSVTK